MVALEEALAEVADAIQTAEEQLDELREHRATIVEMAIGEGMSQRQIAEQLRITHTGVQRILRERESTRETIAVLQGNHQASPDSGA